MRKCLLFVFTFISFNAFAQFTVTGKISDDKNKPAEGASVLIYKKADSALVKSSLTSKAGEYVFEKIESGEYFIQISLVSHASITVNVSVLDKDVKVAEQKLKGDGGMLTGVTVTAKKPFLEQRADKLVVNVENSATAAGGTALEVLQKVPGILVRSEGISIAGKSSVAIYIDGRPSQYNDVMQLLRDMPSSNIEKIEVIANPGAKYDAAGGSIINVVLKKNANLGTNGNVQLATGIGLYSQKKDTVDRNFWRLVPSFSINHRKGKINLYGSYSNFNRTDFEYNIFVRNIDTSVFTQTNYSPNYYHGHNYRAGIDFYVDKKNTFGFLYRGFYRTGGGDATNSTDQTKKGTGNLLSNFQTATKRRFTNISNAVNFNWKHSFDSTGKELNVDLDYSNFALNSSGAITNTVRNGTATKNNQVVKNPVNFAVLKIDYVHPFNEKTKIEAGLKNTFATINNKLTFDRPIATTVDRQNDFKYTENINAAYVNIKRNSGKWDMTAGLRAEQTVAKGKDGSKVLLDRNYWQLFPSVFVSRKITEKISIVGQYARRVNRPSFQQQNPFVFLLDSLTYTRGNPLIRPEIANQTELSVTYESQPFFTASYNTTKDVIFENAPQQDGNITYAQPENLASAKNINLQVNLPIPLGKKFEGFVANIFSFNEYNAKYLDLVYKTKRWNYTLYSQLSYKPIPTLTIEASGFYSTKQLNEFIVLKPFGSLNFGISKTFWEKKGRLSLNVNDVFYSQKIPGEIVYSYIDIRFYQRFESRNLRLTFSYSFGNQKLKASRERKSASDAENNRVKTN
jgi:hypothetical protein